MVEGERPGLGPRARARSVEVNNANLTGTFGRAERGVAGGGINEPHTGRSSGVHPGCWDWYPVVPLRAATARCHLSWVVAHRPDLGHRVYCEVWVAAEPVGKSAAFLCSVCRRLIPVLASRSARPS